ncbi:TonB-dependent receptor [Acanthopleuribacter pedis]|uniref:TonB-dependent receptor n=1 Tax=Acanthopleuribacter pedis TaxID=442870 RepID=A0A8J7QA35_9BACT|nr:TonB-dependent receptor [Acanthopleuribacter pedis]MBO1321571.1 TonB-dependent receptor [Acanthopleuribacter pedis]
MKQPYPLNARTPLLWLIFFTACPLWAQQAGLEISVLLYPERTPLADQAVTISNEATGWQRVLTTNALGKIRIDGLSPADYRVVAAADTTYSASEAERVGLRANFVSSVTLLRFPRQTQTESLTVTSGFAKLNGINGEISSTLSEAEIETLPIEGRDITRALFRLPNVTQATGFFPEAPNVSINGANALYTNYMIDGLDNNENFLGGQKFPIPVGFTRNITVLTNNYSAEFGRTGNGIFNITSKSGGNTMEGEVFYVTRPGPSLDASSPFAQRDLSGNQVQDGFRRDQFGFAVGGALVPDRTFYFVNLEHTADDKDNLLRSPSLGVNETVAGANEFTYTSLKIDHYWSPQFSSALRANLGQVALERQGGGLEGGVTFPSAANRQDRNAALVALTNTYIGDGFTYEANLQYSRFRWDYGEPVSGPGPQVTVLDAQGITAGVLGHPGYIFDDLERTYQLQQKVSWVRGNHVFKVGYDLIAADFELLGGGNVNGNYLVQLNQNQQQALIARGLGAGLTLNDLPADVTVLDYAVELQPKAFGRRQTMHGLFIEDQISIGNRLDLTLGLRYDYDNLTAVGGASGDKDNLAPRISANYALDERSVLRGGAGLFYEKLPYAIYSDALQQNSTAEGFRQQLNQLIALGILPADTDLDAITFDGNLTVNPTGVTYLGGPTPDQVANLRDTAFSNERRILNPNGWENPETLQLSLGYQRQIRDNMLFYVDLMYSRSENLVRLRNLNAPSAYGITREQAETLSDAELSALVRGAEEADATRPVAPVAGGARNIVISETEGGSRYKAANFNLVKDRGGDIYSFRLGYTLSELRNDTEDINFRAQDSNRFGDEWGPSINDRTHVISLLGAVHPLPRWTLSLAGLIQSGQPINRIPDASVFGTTDLNGDGRAFGDAYQGNSDRYPGEARNSDRLPWSRIFDLGLSYRLDLGGNRLEVRADIFNLTNEDNLSGYSNNATQSNQIQAGPAGTPPVQRNAGPPRQYQFSLSYLF